VRAETALRDAATTLAAAGVDSPRWDAEQLLMHATGVGRAELAMVDAIDADALSTFRELVDRRAGRVPLQHLVGVVGFRYIDVEVGPGVFIPRPETELVAGLAIDAARACGSHPVVVDLCSGSGVISLAVANEVPSAAVHAVERDYQAVEWLTRNAEIRAAAGDPPIAVHHGDAADALPELSGAVDIVVSNPPYVAEEELPHVDPEVRDHDPRVALVAGNDGFDVIRTVVETAERLLRPGGRLVVEHSERQGDACLALVAARGGWVDVVDHRDLAGRPRCVTARWEGRL
jgi:release factor glutamine methyltransferase